jgi:hypothetical protein
MSPANLAGDMALEPAALHMPVARPPVGEEREQDEALLALARRQRRAVVGGVLGDQAGADVRPGGAQGGLDRLGEVVGERGRPTRPERADRHRGDARRPAATRVEVTARLLVDQPQQEDVVAVDHRRVRRVSVRGPHRSAVEGLQALAARVHLVHEGVDLETHVTDVVNLLDYENLEDAVLVGHSYAGIVITGVADRRPRRLNAAVYLDTSPLPNGKAIADVQPPSSASTSGARSSNSGTAGAGRCRTGRPSRRGRSGARPRSRSTTSRPSRSAERRSPTRRSRPRCAWRATGRRRSATSPCCAPREARTSPCFAG